MLFQTSSRHDFHPHMHTYDPTKLLYYPNPYPSPITSYSAA